eukprot:CAMPEP_0194770184 /NCGR_PEP_ID=MMETSP0323_2-20130528/45474_1 /TAXON_ID=2866 ORGANISM="Crypthecodinium cohnii, Strain Seligo" /NCGR_SAMPLE_ID=MMETSP0323_2 /ASSEMBLY_ACC=CAM_ASM_000346 /LENGTH=35 /DNA_ID= /DNA_START= /DNA_END= /DNA_ORIENTATION=
MARQGRHVSARDRPRSGPQEYDEVIKEESLKREPT